MRLFSDATFCFMMNKLKIEADNLTASVIEMTPASEFEATTREQMIGKIRGLRSFTSFVLQYKTNIEPLLKELQYATK